MSFCRGNCENWFNFLSHVSPNALELCRSEWIRSKGGWIVLWLRDVSVLGSAKIGHEWQHLVCWYIDERIFTGVGLSFKCNVGYDLSFEFSFGWEVMFLGWMDLNLMNALLMKVSLNIYGFYQLSVDSRWQTHHDWFG